MATKLIGVALVAVAATAACTSKSRLVADAGSDGAVQVWPGLAVASAADIPNEWTAGWMNGTFFLRDEPSEPFAKRASSVSSLSRG